MKLLRPRPAIVEVSAAYAPNNDGVTVPMPITSTNYPPRYGDTIVCAFLSRQQIQAGGFEGSGHTAPWNTYAASYHGAPSPNSETSVGALPWFPGIADDYFFTYPGHSLEDESSYGLAFRVRNSIGRGRWNLNGAANTLAYQAPWHDANWRRTIDSGTVRVPSDVGVLTVPPGGISVWFAYVIGNKIHLGGADDWDTPAGTDRIDPGGLGNWLALFLDEEDDKILDHSHVGHSASLDSMIVAMVFSPE